MVSAGMATGLFTSLFACRPTAGIGALPASQTFTLDHNRIILDLPFRGSGRTEATVRVWVDNGNPELWIAEPLAKGLGQGASQQYEIGLGDQWLRLSSAGGLRLIPGREIGTGLGAQVNLPSTVLRRYGVVVDYPNRTFTLAPPGTARFDGPAVPATVNPSNGLVRIPCTIAGDSHEFGVDLGATVSVVSAGLLSSWRRAFPQWPHMIGAVGSANMWGFEDEPSWELVRVPEVRCGDSLLGGVIMAALPNDVHLSVQERAGAPVAGLIGADALGDRRVGLDYARSQVHLAEPVVSRRNGLDVVGLILRASPERQYTVIGVADYEGRPSVPQVRKGDRLLAVEGAPVAGLTMGQVWSVLSGVPGTIKTLAFTRDTKRFTVRATVRRFLGS